LLREAAELPVWVHRDRLVGPFECGLVGYVIRIEADVSVNALEA
jgi:hypothetical protein